MDKHELLSDEQVEAELVKLNVAWSAIPGQGLVRVFATGSFKAGLGIVARIGELAEQLNHHPDIHLTYDDVEVTLSTHSVSGVTWHDIELAQAIDNLDISKS